MRIETGNHKLWIIGDPHLGREFKNGVPLHRRGEREAAQMAQFRAELAEDAAMVVMIGDLFDKPFVPLPVIHATAAEIIAAALDRPHVTFVMLAGNHDKSRQLEVRGAWELLELAIRWLPNVRVVNETTVIEGVALYPWQWDTTAEEQVARFGSSCPIAIGHWDLQDFGGDTSHMVPAKALAKWGVSTIVSGHYHLPGEYEVDGIPVICTGSMQPYTHAEDPAGDLYVTLTVDEALARDDLGNKCVRILLQPGEDMPEIDCLQLTNKRADVEADELEISDIGIGGFDIHKTLADEFTSNEVPAEVQTFIKERMGAFA
jgi:DNA repair exonuclease SbcCD nuclease subunit